MRVTVARPTELGDSECRAWRELQDGNPYLSNAFLDVGFSQAISQVKNQARVAVIEDAGVIVGFFPFEIGRSRVGRPIGAGVNDCQGIIRAAETRLDATSLIRACGLRTWEFDHLQIEQDEFSKMHRRRHASPIIETSRGFEAYVKNRRQVSTKLIQTIARNTRRLGREIGDVDVEFESLDRESLNQVIAWKRDQYARTIAPDVLKHGWVRDLLDILLDHQDSDCRLVVSTLRAGDQLVAGHLGLCSRRMLASWFPAYDPNKSQYSPGLILALGFIEGAAESGLDYVDLGRGAADYKNRLKTGELYVAEGTVSDGSSLARLRSQQRAAGASRDQWVRSYFQRHPGVRVAARRLRRKAHDLRAH